MTKPNEFDNSILHYWTIICRLLEPFGFSVTLDGSTINVLGDDVTTEEYKGGYMKIDGFSGSSIHNWTMKPFVTVIERIRLLLPFITDTERERQRVMYLGEHKYE